MKKNSIVILIFITFMGLSSIINAEEIWIDGLITADGTGMSTDPNIHLAKAKIRAFNAAKASAQMALYSALESMAGDKKLLTEDSEQVANIIVTKTKGVLRGAFVFNKQLSMDDGVPVSVVTMAVCADRTHPACRHRPTFAGQLGNDFYEFEKTKSENRAITSTQEVTYKPQVNNMESTSADIKWNDSGENKGVPEGGYYEPLASNTESTLVGLPGNIYDENKVTSGLVVDLKSLVISAKSKKIPVIALQQKDENLQILYSIEKMDANARSELHPAIYTTKGGLKKDYIANRIGPNVLYLTAYSIVKDQYGDEIVLISDKEVDILNQAVSLDDTFLKSASVAFISY